MNLFEKLYNKSINEIKTFKGTPIKRFKNNVGKFIDKQLYVHKNYADEVIPSNLLKNSQRILEKKFPDFVYNSIMWNMKNNDIRFDESPDFDFSSEPKVGNYVSINLENKSIRVGKSDYIWHHKWLWVKDDYGGFDVEESKNWSKFWLSKLKEPAKGTKLSFESQLKKFGVN
jgi:hypothetical protein